MLMSTATTGAVAAAAAATSTATTSGPTTSPPASPLQQPSNQEPGSPPDHLHHHQQQQQHSTPLPPFSLISGGFQSHHQQQQLHHLQPHLHEHHPDIQHLIQQQQQQQQPHHHQDQLIEQLIDLNGTGDHHHHHHQHHHVDDDDMDASVATGPASSVVVTGTAGAVVNNTIPAIKKQINRIILIDSFGRTKTVDRCQIRLFNPTTLPVQQTQSLLTAAGSSGKPQLIIQHQQEHLNGGGQQQQQQQQQSHLEDDTEPEDLEGCDDDEDEDDIRDDHEIELETDDAKSDTDSLFDPDQLKTGGHHHSMHLHGGGGGSGVNTRAGGLHSSLHHHVHQQQQQPHHHLSVIVENHQDTSGGCDKLSVQQQQQQPDKELPNAIANIIDNGEFRALQPEQPTYQTLTSVNGKLSPSNLSLSPNSSSSYATLTPLQPLPPISTMSEKFAYGAAAHTVPQGNLSATGTAFNGLGGGTAAGNASGAAGTMSVNGTAVYVYEKVVEAGDSYATTGALGPNSPDDVTPKGFEVAYSTQVNRTNLQQVVVRRGGDVTSPDMSPDVTEETVVSGPSGTTLVGAGNVTLNGSLVSTIQVRNSTVVQRQQQQQQQQQQQRIKRDLSPVTSASQTITAAQQKRLTQSSSNCDLSSSSSGDIEEINTKELAERISAELKRYSIPQAIFAQRVLCRSQGTLSDLLRNPKPWSKLKSGRETFRRMYKWLQEPEFQRMSALRLAAAQLPQNGSGTSAGTGATSTTTSTPTSHNGQSTSGKRLQQQQQQLLNEDNMAASHIHQQQQQQHGDQLKTGNTVAATATTNPTTATAATTAASTTKKTRLVFTNLQRRTLQAIFKETKRPSKEMQITIARQLGLEPATVGNFFMNARRRSTDKWKDDDQPPPPQQQQQQHSTTNASDMDTLQTHHQQELPTAITKDDLSGSGCPSGDVSDDFETTQSIDFQSF